MSEGDEIERDTDKTAAEVERIGNILLIACGLPTLFLLAAVILEVWRAIWGG